VLTTGRATGLVTRTGPAGSLGRITELVARTKPGPTPLQRRIAALGRILGFTAIAVSAVVFALGVLAGRGPEQDFRPLSGGPDALPPPTGPPDD